MQLEEFSLNTITFQQTKINIVVFWPTRNGTMAESVPLAFEDEGRMLDLIGQIPQIDVDDEEEPTMVEVKERDRG